MPFLIGGNLRHRKQETLGLHPFHGHSELSLIIGSSRTLHHQSLIDNVSIEAVIQHGNVGPVIARKRSHACTRTSLIEQTTPRIAGYLALKAESNDRYWRHILKSVVDCRLIDGRIVVEANNASARAHDLRRSSRPA